MKQRGVCEESISCDHILFQNGSSSLNKTWLNDVSLACGISNHNRLLNLFFLACFISKNIYFYVAFRLDIFFIPDASCLLCVAFVSVSNFSPKQKQFHRISALFLSCLACIYILNPFHQCLLFSWSTNWGAEWIFKFKYLHEFLDFPHKSYRLHIAHFSNDTLDHLRDSLLFWKVLIYIIWVSAFWVPQRSTTGFGNFNFATTIKRCNELLSIFRWMHGLY